MKTLYHFELCPFSRQIRVLLAEKQLEFSLQSEKYWLKNESFLNLNPLGTVPVLKDGKLTIVGSFPIIGYLEEEYPETSLVWGKAADKAEIRRLLAWFNVKFDKEVSSLLIEEKVIGFYNKNSAPRSDNIRKAKNSLYSYLDYMTTLLEKRSWLAGNKISMADIAAASHLSVLDFLNDVPWPQYKAVAEWYSLIKSRPSFRPLLEDYVQGFTPPEHYANLDF